MGQISFAVKRRKRQRIMDLEVFDKSSFEEDDDQDEKILCYNDFNYHKKIKNRSLLPCRKRDYKSAQLRKSLRPRGYSVIGAGISTRDLGYNDNRRNLIKLGDHRDHHHASGDQAIRVIRTSKFVRKGTIHKGRVHRRRR
ncbi:hypothetical protein PanWU01x14_060620 [Parasponia andersonii]|uniref:Uncharacterized protein n=1 Tax=Parasponia andersonii TaxID=3476 RepID=A0A2P5DIV3_PARAD|nr:hypothetical protein PanWU01x14_060620 [Parasponia andersonii]